LSRCTGCLKTAVVYCHSDAERSEAEESACGVGKNKNNAHTRFFTSFRQKASELRSE
jgi:hypothetical protein